MPWKKEASQGKVIDSAEKQLDKAKQVMFNEFINMTTDILSLTGNEKLRDGRATSHPFRDDSRPKIKHMEGNYLKSQNCVEK